MKPKRDRDIEKAYKTSQIVRKLKRLVTCLETGKPHQIQIANERITIPANANFSIEHEREGNEEELEFQFKWTR